MMRKMHYNEGMNIKLARQLIASELEEDEDVDEEMTDDTEETREETEEISVDPPQEGKESWTPSLCVLDESFLVFVKRAYLCSSHFC